MKIIYKILGIMAILLIFYNVIINNIQIYNVINNGEYGLVTLELFGAKLDYYYEVENYGK